MSDIGKIIIVIVDDSIDVEVQYVGEQVQNGKSIGAVRGNEKTDLSPGNLNAIRQIATRRRQALRTQAAK